MFVRALVTAAAIATASVGYAQENGRVMSPAEAREFAVAALQNGFPQDAILIARALLARNPDDVSAHLLWAEAALIMADTPAIREHALAAFRASQNPDAKFQAARLVAISYLQDERPTLAQIWLRRARGQASTQDQIDRLAVDYRQVRQLNPLNVDVSLSATPSSNVNNGSANTTMLAPFFTSDSGIVFTEAEISDESQALDGWLYGTTIRLSYRLHESQTQRGNLSFAGSYNGVVFSAESEAAAVTVTEDDYAQGQASLSYSHQWLAREHATVFRLATGRSWYGGDILTDFSSASLGRKWAIGDSGSFGLTATVENTLYKSDGVISDSSVLQATRAWDFENGDRLSFSATFRDTTADDDGRSFYSNKVSAGYVFGETWNDVKFSLNASREWRDYGPILLAPDGRSDMKTTVSLNAAVRGFDIYGFHPTVTLSSTHNQSNIALYETKSFGIGFGFASSF